MLSNMQHHRIHHYNRCDVAQLKLYIASYVFYGTLLYIEIIEIFLVQNIEKDGSVLHFTYVAKQNNKDFSN
jgi:hypothetical protein